MRLSFSLLFIAFALMAAEPADLLITARHIVTMDGQRRVLNDGAVAVRGERIIAVGPRAELEKQYTPKQRVNRPNAILTPGLVNTHTHAPMSLFRGIADDLALQEWLTKYIFPAEAKNVDPEFVRWGTLLACAEMALSGTTTYTDMYYFEEVIAAATKQVGLRGVLGQTVIRFPVADAKTPQEALARAEKFILQYKNDPLIVPAVAPHAPYTNSDEVLRSARQLADKHGVPLVIHLSETRKENEDSQKEFGKSPTQRLNDLGILNGRTIAAHAIWLSAEDIAILAKRNVGVAHCPSSNMKLASGVAKVPELLAAKVNVGLGPDGPAGSNNDFDLLEEANAASNLQKVSRMDPQVLPATVAFELATIGGARVLGMEKEIGSLEAGKRADLVLWSLDAPRTVPLYNVYSQLVYAIKGADATDTMVNGRWVVRDRQLLTVDRKQIMQKAAEYRERVQRSLQ